VVVSAIAGPAGVGKTAVALHVAHQLRAHYPDGQLFVYLRGAEPDPLAAAEVLGGFLRALGVDATQLPDDVEQPGRVVAQPPGRPARAGGAGRRGQ
jgi:DNA helicase TIP49 (TBP-interacting protein)